MSHPVRSIMISTRRLKVHALVTGPPSGIPLVILHGNLSSARFFEPLLAALPDDVTAVAMDMRGYGDTEPLPVNATHGLGDWAEDLEAFIDSVGIAKDQPIDLLGWSMGGGVIQQYAISHPHRVRSLMLECPIAPFGFGGTRDVHGQPTWPDYAGSGGGAVSTDLVDRLRMGDRSEDAPTSPRVVMNTFDFRPGFRLPRDLEDALVDAMLGTRTGVAHYPGDYLPSEHWPGTRPGVWGVANAMSPKYCDLSQAAALDPGCQTLWVRGAEDVCVSDTSLSDWGHLGAIGEAPGWPGARTFPAQPMIGQTRAILERFRANGGQYTEVAMADAGHAPHLEQSAKFIELLLDFRSGLTS